jgi:hypothetical protein
MRLLPPAVALVLVGAWFGFQRLAISAAESENGMLRKHIAAASQAAPEAATATAAPERPAKNNGALDWITIAAQLVDMQRSGGIGDVRAITRLQQRLQSMTAQEILDALDEIATLGLSAADRALIDRVLMQPLMQKDPERALTRFIDRLQGNDAAMNGQLIGGLRDWARKDASKADAWLDQQIAAGKFESKSLDGRNLARMQLEGSLIGVLLTSSPNTAAHRLAAMPEDQRGDLIGNFTLNSLKEESLPALAKLIREQVPATDQARTFALQAAQRVAQGGYAKVSEFLARTQPTPAERIACVEQAVATSVLSNDRKITRDDLDSVREWVGSQAPNATDSVTGKLLCAAALNNRKLDFAEAAELAVQYSQARGNDDVLITFVENWAMGSSKEQARVLAARITDERRRAEMLKRLE